MNAEIRRPGRRRLRGQGGGRRSLEQRIIARHGTTLQGLWLPREQYLTLASGKVAQLNDSSGLGRHATQASDPARFTWVPDAFRPGRGGMSGAGMQSLMTAAINLTALERIVAIALFVDSVATIETIVAFGSLANAGSLGLVVNDPGAVLSARGRAAAATSEVRSAASFPMSSPGVVAVSADYALATQATRVWHDGVDASSTWPSDADLSASAPGNLAFVIGNRAEGDLGISGTIGPLAFVGYTGAQSIDVPALVATMADIKTEWLS